MAALCPWPCSHKPFVARVKLEPSSTRMDAWVWGNGHCTVAAAGASLHAPLGCVTLVCSRAPQIGQKSPSGPQDCS